MLRRRMISYIRSGEHSALCETASRLEARKDDKTLVPHMCQVSRQALRGYLQYFVPGTITTRLLSLPLFYLLHGPVGRSSLWRGKIQTAGTALLRRR